MGIDGIGKKPPAAPDTTAGAGPTEKTGATFEVPGTQAPERVRATSQVDATSPLARLEAGEIDVNAYVELKVDEATKHLGAMPPTDLADLKSLLREKLVSDPSMADLVRQSTGQTPTIPEE